MSLVARSRLTKVRLLAHFSPAIPSRPSRLIHLPILEITVKRSLVSSAVTITLSLSAPCFAGLNDGITSVTVDSTFTEITITGSGLSGDAATIVTLGGVMLDLISESPEELVAACPGSPPLCEAGDWSLQVNTFDGEETLVPVGQQVWNLTIGAVGPQGETGAAGSDGSVGPEGPEGPRGATGDQGPAGPIVQGTLCGLMTNDGRSGVTCQGYNPLVSCPEGYTQQVWKVASGNGSMGFCAKE